MGIVKEIVKETAKRADSQDDTAAGVGEDVGEGIVKEIVKETAKRTDIQDDTAAGLGKEIGKETAERADRQGDTTAGIGAGTATYWPSRTQKLIMEYLILQPYATVAQLAEAIPGITMRTARYNLDILRRRGLIRRIGSTKSGKWIVQEQR